MEIFYLKKDEFLNSINVESLKKFSDGRTYLCKDKHLEHLCGLFLTKFVAKHIYGLSSTDIILKGQKPIFSTGGIHFSISHSNNIILVAFNNSEIGADVEYMRPRNFEKIMKRCNKNVKNPAREEFYKFWTVKEAEIKLGKEYSSLFSTILNEDYIVTCVSSNILITNFKIKELTLKKDVENLDLSKEFTNPQVISIN